MSSPSCPEGIAYSNLASLGIRLSVYVQAALCLWPCVVHVAISLFSLPAQPAMTIFTRWRANVWTYLLTGAILLIASYSAAGKEKLSPFHAVIVLNLCWIIFVSVYINRAITSGTVWINNVLNDKLKEAIAMKDSGSLRFQHFLYVAHLIGMAVLGLLVFHNVRKLGHGNQCPDDTVLWMFGSYSHLVATGVRRLWLVIYSLILVPYLNMLMVDLVYVVSSWVVQHTRSTVVGLFTDGATPKSNMTKAVLTMSVIPTFLIVMLIVSTERTISANPVADGGNHWGFARVVPLLALFAPLYDVTHDIIHLAGLWKSRETNDTTIDLEDWYDPPMPRTKSTPEGELSKALLAIQHEFRWISFFRRS